MKKRIITKGPRAHILRGVRLFREDIDALESILDSPVKFIVGDMQYDTIEEIKEDHGNTIRALYVESESIEIRIEAKNYWGVFCARNCDDEHRLDKTEL